MSNYIDLDVSGASTMPGGEYGSVDISGAGKVEGNLRCTSLDISGAGKVFGDVVCEGAVDCSGSTKITGSLDAGSLDCSGSFTVEGYCNVQGKLDASGAVKFLSALRAEAMDASGAFSCAGDVSVERFVSDGLCHIEGLLNAETVEMTLVGENRIADIGGSRITVRSERRRHLFKGQSGKLYANSIEGDAVELEYTEADAVRGNTVAIGPGCMIRRVEYTDSLFVDPEAEVGEQMRIQG